MKILASRLYQRRMEEQKEKMKKYEDSKRDIAWGSQIRSYVFHPYNMVKDHRTNYETSNIQQVMDGDLDEFIEQYLVTFGEA
jgi:peptide chain release factor 2